MTARQQPRRYDPKRNSQRIAAACAIAALATVTACGSSGSAAPAQPAAQGAGTAPAAPCKLKTTFDYLLRTTEPGMQPQAQEIGNVSLASCTDSLTGFAATAGQAAGECTTIAKASDNPGYNPGAVPAPPLKHVIQAAGPGC